MIDLWWHHDSNQFLFVRPMKVNSEFIVPFFFQVGEVTFSFFIFHYFIRFHYWPKMRVEMEINATKKFSRKVGTRKVRKEPGFASKLWIYMFYKQKYMFPIAKTGENTDTLKIMNYFGIFENLTRVFLVSKKWRGRGTINSESTFTRLINCHSTMIINT